MPEPLEAAYEACWRLAGDRELLWQLIVEGGKTCWVCPGCGGAGYITKADDFYFGPTRPLHRKELCPLCVGRRCITVEWAGMWLKELAALDESIARVG